MNFPKIKNALLCRILTYVIVLGSCVLSVAVVTALDFIPDTLKTILSVAPFVLMAVYIFKNIGVLVMMDITLGMIHALNTARKCYTCKANGTSPEEIKEAVTSRISKHGKECDPALISPVPDILRYRSQISLTVYAKSVEKIIMTYSAECLDKQVYRQIENSARINARKYVGHRKRIITDPKQKKVSPSTAAVAVIFASRVEQSLQKELFEVVQKTTGEDENFTLLICVIDLENKTYTFDSLRDVYSGFAYPACNRAYNLVKKYVFGGKISVKDNPHCLEPIKDLDPEMSLWQFVHMIKKELADNSKNEKKIFESMHDGEFTVRDDIIYYRQGERGVSLWTEIDEDTNTVSIEEPDLWTYPKSTSISKKDIEAIRRLVDKHFADKGIKIKYDSLDDED